ncbi:retron Ec67 family RNA-directed DNA polymerase/endonuclease [Acinetobacter baumannii]|uniref:retron Ec67 family RNA-directed DNA polymerase/endonuclease n=1 Tax=Acinetobacter baumannii TaxID=470 RepID=UPI001AEC7B64|nr:retron Ec67 family RNA-directed DNA polymerase/endonuclease [Acinetobacter baumannii]MBP2811661.1 retron Ec67 family RNA-directed DNA polymerase/endonuclease [Acinetobacter baumannii]MCU4658382.1 retron Ec67 family RNA-directed DNA polymerase/endonuclease [Acinetobacter baumannii]MDV7448245.1 retron Ec67 family RNA-directed DNA polymerase/endonuclease [Acinetobacter baumannii]
MKYLKELKSCQTQKDLANLLGYSEKNFTRILFSQNISLRYQSFEIPKKNGDKRKILAPTSELKVLQTRLSILLSNCYEELELKRLSTSSYIKCISSHGFRKKLKINIPASKQNRKTIEYKEINFGIYSNAKQHTGKRLVLNIDLKDFFESITFSRVVGFFTKNKLFLLPLDIAVLIAQIVTYRTSTSQEGFLPQGSPCSPIISNLIGNILDVKMVKLAKEYKFTYTRYVDDLTLSTNLPQFSEDIIEFDGEKWVLGSALNHTINSSKFKINPKKTRLTDKYNKQEVTGLTVNKKVNIDRTYYRYTRSMVQKFCAEGEFFKSKVHMDKQKISREALNGILSHIYQIKNQQDINFPNCARNFSELNSLEKLYAKFLFHHYFVHPQRMLIIGEGYTDPLHFKLACHKLYKESLSFLKFSSLEGTKRFSKITGYGGGTGLLKIFLQNYKQFYKARNICLKPCLIIVDGDSDGDAVISKASAEFKTTFKKISHSSMTTAGLLDWYHIFNNLYILQLPKNKVIEDFYDPLILTIPIGSKTFHSDDKKKNTKFDSKIHYGKKVLLEKIIYEQQDTIDFSKFDLIFNTIFHIQFYHYIYCNMES